MPTCCFQVASLSCIVTSFEFVVRLLIALCMTSFFCVIFLHECVVACILRIILRLAVLSRTACAKIAGQHSLLVTDTE